MSKISGIPNNTIYVIEENGAEEDVNYLKRGFLNGPSNIDIGLRIEDNPFNRAQNREDDAFGDTLIYSGGIRIHDGDTDKLSVPVPDIFYPKKLENREDASENNKIVEDPKENKKDLKGNSEDTKGTFEAAVRIYERIALVPDPLSLNPEPITSGTTNDVDKDLGASSYT